MKAIGVILALVGVALALAGGSMLWCSTLGNSFLVFTAGIMLAIPGVIILNKCEDKDLEELYRV